MRACMCVCVCVCVWRQWDADMIQLCDCDKGYNGEWGDADGYDCSYVSRQARRSNTSSTSSTSSTSTSRHRSSSSSFEWSVDTGGT
jgi:hypothetical protein